MANRYTNQFPGTLEKKVVNLWLQVAIGSTGAPTITRGKGFASIARVSAGKYDVTLGTPASTTDRKQVDLYNLLLAAQATFLNATHSAAPDMTITSSTVNSDGKFQILFSAAGTPTDPASGEKLLLAVQLSNSASA